MRTYIPRLQRSLSRKLSSCGDESKPLGQPAPWTHPHLLSKKEVTPAITQKELAQRRFRLKRRLETKNENCKVGVISLSNSLQLMSHDVPHSFHQNSNFWYLTGFEEPNSLLFMFFNRRWETHLFVEENDEQMELWEGPKAGVNGAKSLLNLHNVHSNKQTNNFLSSYFADILYYDVPRAGSSKLEAECQDFLTKHKNREPLGKEVEKLRLKKSKSEIFLLKKSSEIASKSMNRAMQQSYPGVVERCVASDFHNHSVKLGATKLAFPAVVAGGSRANTLHYLLNNNKVEEGDMILMDAGCVFGGYASDVTRTWPVSGKFSPAQKVIYEIVLEVNKNCIKMAKPGVSINELYELMQRELKRHFKEISVKLSSNNSKSAPCPHNVGHHLGIDVHDCPSISRNEPLQPGMVIAIEPGLYIRTDDEQVYKEFRGIGIRIEDDLLISEEGPFVMTSFAAKELKDIEALKYRVSAEK